jgi:hypothetical protein
VSRIPPALLELLGRAADRLYKRLVRGEISPTQQWPGISDPTPAIASPHGDSLHKPASPTIWRGWRAIAHPDAIALFTEALIEKENNLSLSLYDRALKLANHELTLHDVEDLGVPLPSNTIQHQRFRLNSDLRHALSEVSKALQNLVNEIRQYLSKSLFTQSPIDPGGHLLHSCHGIKNLNLLGVNFCELTRHMLRAAIRIHSLHGMDKIYSRNLSPVQTTSSWNDALEGNQGMLSPLQVSRVYLQHPRYQFLYSTEAREHVENWIDSADHVGPSGPWPPLEEERAARPELLAAFPPRSLEYIPKKKFHAPGAETLTFALFARSTSFDQHEDWKLPEATKLVNSNCQAAPEAVRSSSS